MKPRLIVEQKITAFVNKYEIYECQADGNKGRLAALAQQKRLAFKEKVTFYSGTDMSQAVFSFRAEKVIDVHGHYMVEDAGGKLVGSFKKEFGKSLINSTWNILGEDGQPELRVSESNQALAILRRFGGIIPVVGDFIDLLTLLLRYHFVFTDVRSGQVVGRYQKTKLLRDNYELSMTDEAYDQKDWRVLASLAVALDALQSR